MALRIQFTALVRRRKCGLACCGRLEVGASALCGSA